MGYAAVTQASPAATPADADKGADLARLKRMVSEAQSLTAEARKESLIDVDYYDGHQWSKGEKDKLRERGQPDIVINRTRASINGILGVSIQGKSEPKAYPRTPKDEDSSDTATDCLRFIADFNRFDRIKQDAFRDFLVPGSMGALIGADADKQVTVEPIRWEELLYDPKSRRPDFGDARFMGIAKWMYADDVAAMYPDRATDIESWVSDGSLIGDVSFMDRPDFAPNAWIDQRQRRLLMVELYYRERGWMRCVFNAGGILAEGKSPYNDDKGRPCNPIEAQSAYVDRHNNRYGVVRDMRGPQDEINKRRSKLLHLLSTSQIQAVDPSAVEVDANAARSEAARPDGVIPFGWQKVPTSDMASGQAELLAEAKAELERLGPNPAVLGRQGADSSGRAVLARQQAGMVELAVNFGALEDWELRVYRQMWSRAKQFWTAPMYIRVTDDEDAPKFIGLNQPKGEMQPVIGPDGQPVADENGQPQMQEGPPLVHPQTYPAQVTANDNVPAQFIGLPHPQAGQPHPQAGQAILGYKNSLAEMDVDITLDSIPDTANIQQEQFQDLTQLVGSNPAYAQQVPFEIMLELSAVPHKRELIDRMKKFSAQNGQQQQQAAQAAQQLQMQEAQAKVGVAQTQAGLNQANALLANAKADQLGAETQSDAMTAPLDVAATQADIAHKNAQAAHLRVQSVDTLFNGIHQRSQPQDPQQPAAGASGA